MPICGICKQEKQNRYQDGIFFHTGDDWLYMRLFICNECMEHVAVQQSYHELCYECGYEDGEQFSTEEIAKRQGRSATRLQVLKKAIRDFEKFHEDILKHTPTSTDPDCMHPGSLHDGVRRWREKYML